MVDFVLDADRRLTFANTAVDHGFAAPTSEYRSRWAVFDNDTGQVVGATSTAVASAPALRAPAALPTNAADFLSVEIETVHPNFPAWSRPVRVYFRRTSSGWQTVGIERDL